MEFSWSIFVKDTNIKIYFSNAGKALFVWFRHRKDNKHLTSVVLGKYQKQESRTKTVTSQAKLVNMCHYSEKTPMVGLASQS